MSAVEFDAFISYAWNQAKDAVRQFASELKKASVKVWIDIEQMKDGFINEKMCDGILNSAIFICYVTEDYAKRENAMKELNYATNTQTPVVYVIFEENNDHIYKRIGQVGFIMRDTIYHGFYNKKLSAETSLSQIINAVRSEIAKVAY